MNKSKSVDVIFKGTNITKCLLKKDMTQKIPKSIENTTLYNIEKIKILRKNTIKILWEICMIENNKEIFYFMDENFASLEKKLGF